MSQTHDEEAPLDLGEIEQEVQRSAQKKIGRFGLSSADTQDIAQESLLTLLLSVADGRYPRKAAERQRWIRATVKYVAQNWAKKKRRRRWVDLDAVAPSDSRHRASDAAERREDLEWALSQLSDEEHRLVTERWMQEQMLKSMANKRNCSINTVRTRLHKTVDKLRTFLDP